MAIRSFFVIVVAVAATCFVACDQGAAPSQPTPDASSHGDIDWGSEPSAFIECSGHEECPYGAICAPLAENNSSVCVVAEGGFGLAACETDADCAGGACIEVDDEYVDWRICAAPEPEVSCPFPMEMNGQEYFMALPTLSEEDKLPFDMRAEVDVVNCAFHFYPTQAPELNASYVYSFWLNEDGEIVATVGYDSAKLELVQANRFVVIIHEWLHGFEHDPKEFRFMAKP